MGIPCYHPDGISVYHCSGISVYHCTRISAYHFQEIRPGDPVPGGAGDRHRLPGALRPGQLRNQEAHQGDMESFRNAVAGMDLSKVKEVEAILDGAR